MFGLARATNKDLIKHYVLEHIDALIKCKTHSCWFFQNLCINPEVVRLGNVQMMNDRCLEMQKNKHGQKRKHTVCQVKRSGVAVLSDTLIT